MKQQLQIQKKVERDEKLFVIIPQQNKYFRSRQHRVSRVRQTNSTGNILEEYLYDQDGNRLKKIEYRNGNTSNNETTYYFNSRPVDFIQVRNASGIFNFSYYYMNDKLVASKMQGKQMLYYHDDHLGSTTLVTNQSGDVVENDVYLPYGGIYSGAASSKYLFTGKERDDGTGFDYFGARYYSSQFMHFLQPDKIKNIYDPQNLNSYAYTLNNPYKYVDPTGRLVEQVTRGLNAQPFNPFFTPALYIITDYIANSFTHSYFDITPDNPKDFRGTENFQLGASDKGGELNSRIDQEKGSGTEYSRVPLKTPEGKTDTQFINSLLSEAHKVDESGINYNPIPESPIITLFWGKGENSNSFVSTLIKSTGSNLPKDTRDSNLHPTGTISPGLGRTFYYGQSSNDKFAQKNDRLNKFRNFFNKYSNMNNRR